MDNHYDPSTADWVTAEGRYAAILAEPRFATLVDDGGLLAEPGRAWPVLLALLDTVPDDLLPFVGAGPLETFIVRHGPAYVSELVGEADRNPRLRRAVLNVNLAPGELPPAVEAQLRNAFGPEFRLFAPDAG